MSSVKISGNASGTGTFTISSPNSNTDRTITLPDNTGTILTTGSQIEFGAGTVSAPSISTSGDTNTGIFFPTADTIAFAEGGAEAMRIDNSGNVGIGTTSPSTYGKFATYSSGGWASIDTNGQLFSYQLLDVATAGGRLTGGSSQGELGQIAIEQTTTGAKGGYIRFRTASSGSNVSDERMRIDSSGNVLVGTTGITGGLSGKVFNIFDTGTVRSIVQTTGQFAVYNIGSGGTSTTPTVAGFMLTDSTAGTLNIYASTNHPMLFGTNNTERARITSGGSLLVGTTTESARLTSYRNTGGQALFAHQDVATNDTTAIIRQTTSGGNGGQNIGLLVQIQAQSNTDRIICGQFWNSGTPADRFMAYRNGDMEITGAVATKSTGTTWANPSDIRLKDNIRDYEKGLAELQQVRVREWEYNGKANTTQGTKGIGVVADEVMLVLPQTVDEFEAKLNEDDEEKTKLKRFDATEITWLLVKSVQELKAITDAQTTRIEALEAEVAAMKAN